MDVHDEGKCYMPDDGDYVHKLVIMLAHACGGSPVDGKVKAQKLVFMLSDVDDRAGEAGFYPGADGPYSDVVDEKIRRLNDLGILADGYRTRLADAGRAVAERLAGEDPNMFEVVEEYKDMFNDMSTDEILTYVHLLYPPMAARSMVRTRLERDAEKHVMSMLRKGKISSGKAAELLGRDRQDVIKTAVKKGIQVFEFDEV